MNTTPEQFAMFCEEIRYWQIRLGLMTWNIITSHVDLSDAVGASNNNHNARTSVIKLAKNWNSDYWTPTEYEIRKTAFHECCEVSFSELRWFMDTQYNDNISNQKIHEIIVTLENTLFDDDIYWRGIKNEN